MMQKFESTPEQKRSLPHRRVIVLHPSAWQRLKVWARSALTEERIAEPALVTVTLLLLGWLSYCFYHAMQNYTVIP
jgi:hypothetical protein